MQVDEKELGEGNSRVGQSVERCTRVRTEASFEWSWLEECRKVKRPGVSGKRESVARVFRSLSASTFWARPFPPYSPYSPSLSSPLDPRQRELYGRSATSRRTCELPLVLFFDNSERPLASACRLDPPAPRTRRRTRLTPTGQTYPTYASERSCVSPHMLCLLSEAEHLAHPFPFLSLFSPPTAVTLVGHAK